MLFTTKTSLGRYWARLVTLMLTIALMPGLGELIENVEHLVNDGHLAHVVDHHSDGRQAPGEHQEHEHSNQHQHHAGADDVHEAAHAALEAEHGCTPISHSCGCHASMPVVVDDCGFRRPPRHAAALVQAYPTDTIWWGHHANAPPVPPPNA